jgi:hypothetical protein
LIVATLEAATKQFDKNTIFVFGHALDPLKVTGNIDDVKAMQHFMESLVTYVGSSIKAGKSKDEIMTAKTIPGAPEWQGDGIERGLTAAYEELS